MKIILLEMSLTSGAERAACWNGTGEYNRGTSTVFKKVKKDLNMDRQKIVTYSSNWQDNADKR